MYPSPWPMPQMTATRRDQPKLMDGNPRGQANTRPPPQHSAEMTPALRGPACSSQPPQTAAAIPSTAIKISKMWVTAGTDQLHDVVNSSAVKLRLLQAAGSAFGMRRVIGSQNTEKP